LDDWTYYDDDDLKPGVIRWSARFFLIYRGRDGAPSPRHSRGFQRMARLRDSSLAYGTVPDTGCVMRV